MNKKLYFLVFVVVVASSAYIAVAAEKEDDEKDFGYYQCTNPMEPNMTYYYDEKVMESCMSFE